MSNKFFESHKSKIIISIVWGVGLSCLFRKVCKGRKCVVYSAPDPNEITKNVYLFDNKCYKYSTKNAMCTKDVIENKE